MKYFGILLLFTVIGCAGTNPRPDCLQWRLINNQMKCILAFQEARKTPKARKNKDGFVEVYYD